LSGKRPNRCDGLARVAPAYDGVGLQRSVVSRNIVGRAKAASRSDSSSYPSTANPSVNVTPKTAARQAAAPASGM
jgi:hypothetical protein